MQETGGLYILQSPIDEGGTDGCRVLLSLRQVAGTSSVSPYVAVEATLRRTKILKRPIH